jgi:hypothetical protein
LGEYKIRVPWNSKTKIEKPNPRPPQDSLAMEEPSLMKLKRF